MSEVSYKLTWSREEERRGRVWRFSAYGSPSQTEGDKHFPKGTTLVGFRDFCQSSDGVVETVYVRVRDDYRGRGIGRRLLEMVYELDPMPKVVRYKSVIHPAALRVAQDMVHKYPDVETRVLHTSVQQVVLSADEVKSRLFKQSRRPHA